MMKELNQNYDMFEKRGGQVVTDASNMKPSENESKLINKADAMSSISKGGATKLLQTN